jgi:hypothetical protein
MKPVLLVILVVVGILFLVVVANSWPVGPDYFVYRDTAAKLLAGTTRLYDENGRNFFNPPWTMLLIIPLTFFPLRLGMAILNLASLVVIVISANMFQKTTSISKVYVALSVATLYTCFLLINGQIDGFVLLGLAVSWWSIKEQRPWLLSLGLSLLIIKPLNVALVVIVLALGIRHWPLRDLMKAVALPIALALVSGLFIGFDWPLRYIDSYNAFPPIAEGAVTIWKIGEQFGIPALLIAIPGIIAVILLLLHVWRSGMNEEALSAALVITFIWTTYAWNYHYIMLIPAFICVAVVSRRWAAAIFAITWLLSLRLLVGGAVYSLVDIIYPILIGCAILYSYRIGQISRN